MNEDVTYNLKCVFYIFRAQVVRLNLYSSLEEHIRCGENMFFSIYTGFDTVPFLTLLLAHLWQWIQSQNLYHFW